jgi:hypothetical protein
MTEREPEKVDFDDEEPSEEDLQNSAEMLYHLLSVGALEIMGYDNDNEPIYRFTDICKEEYPELYDLHMAEVNQIANELWQMGLIDLNWTDDDMSVTITPDNFINLKKFDGVLSNDQLNFLETLVVQSMNDLDQMDY